eukprot:scaffold326294_cov75-Attheya_sp.AAC.1
METPTTISSIDECFEDEELCAQLTNPKMLGIKLDMVTKTKCRPTFLSSGGAGTTLELDFNIFWRKYHRGSTASLIVFCKNPKCSQS